MNKKDLILKYFQKKDQLTVKKREYQQTISSLFTWLVENDHVDNDQTSKFFPNITCTAKIIAKQEGIISGIEEIDYLIKKYTGLTFKSFLKGGLKFKNHEVIAEITGKSHEILAYERTILNILQRMSGITTETSSLISLISPISQIQIAATRKTPWTSLDKKAVAIGGGLTHRLNLSDGILVKDNHLALISKAVKSPRVVVAEALKHARRGGRLSLRSHDSPEVERLGLIEIEVENLQQAHQVLKTFKSLKDTLGEVTRRGSRPNGGEISNNTHLAILLDNFSASRAKSLLVDLNNEYGLSEIIFEASGGIDKDNILEWSKTGVDIISLGSLTHSSKAVNLSLDFVSSLTTKHPSS